MLKNKYIIFPSGFKYIESIKDIEFMIEIKLDSTQMVIKAAIVINNSVNVEKITNWT